MDGTSEVIAAHKTARMSGEERREQIVRVAMRLFAERGFRGTTTREIAHAAGVSEAMIFRHFATKEDLYRAILDAKTCAIEMFNACAEFKPLLKAMERGDDRAFFENLARLILDHHKTDMEFTRLLFYSVLEGHQFHHMFIERYVHKVNDLLIAHIAARQRAGTIRKMDPRIITRAFICMVVHHSFTNNLLDKEHTLLDISNEEAARAFTEILLYGVSAKRRRATRRRGGSRKRGT